MTVEEFKALPKNTPILVRFTNASINTHISLDDEFPKIPYYVVIKDTEELDFYQNKHYLTEAGGEGYAQYFIDEIDDWCTMGDLNKFFEDRKQTVKDSLEITEEPEIEEER